MSSNEEVVDLFLKARRTLMLPKRGSEIPCIIEALKICHQGLEKLDPKLDKDYPIEDIHRIKQLLFFVGIPDFKDEKLLRRRAEELTERIKKDFCNDVDSLAYHFVRRYGVKGI